MTNRTKLIGLVGVVGIVCYAYLTHLQAMQQEAYEKLKYGEDKHRSGRHVNDSGTPLPADGVSKGATSTSKAGNATSSVFDRTSSAAKRLADETCDETEELETMGTQWLDPYEYADSVPMIVRNKSMQIAFLDIKAMGSMERATTLVIMPGDGIKFPLAGRGSLVDLSVGQKWCNRRAGWKDAKTITIRPAIIATRQTTQIKGVVFDSGGGSVSMRIFKEEPGKEAPSHFN